MERRKKRSPSRKQAAQEAKCLRCGRCCTDKYIVGDKVYVGEGACKYLDPQKKLCTVYAHRHETNPDCLSLRDGIALGVFPADCPYVADLPDYVAPSDRVVDAATLRLIERGKIVTSDELDEHLRHQAERGQRKGKKGPSRRR